MSSVLVAYASKYGSTREVCDAVADEMRECGCDVDVRCAADVKDLEGYSAVVLGTALYYFMLHGDARKFLRRNRKKLSELPVALFGMGPFNNDPAEFADVLKQIDRAVEKRPWLSPVAVTAFGGRFDPEHLRFPDNNPGMKSLPASDARDWDAIRSWAASLPALTGVEGHA